MVKNIPVVSVFTRICTFKSETDLLKTKQTSSKMYPAKITNYKYLGLTKYEYSSVKKQALKVMREMIGKNVLNLHF